MAIAAPLAWAQQPAAKSQPEAWQQFVNATTIMLIKVDTGSLDEEPWEKIEAALSPETQVHFFKWSQFHRDKVEILRDAVGGASIYVAVDIRYGAAQGPLRIYLPKAAGSNLQSVLRLLGISASQSAQVQGGYVLLTPGSQPEVDTDLISSLSTDGVHDAADNPYSQRISPSNRPAFGEAVAAVEGKSVPIAISPPEYLRSTFRDLLPLLPPELGGGPTSVLVDGAEWTAIGMDLDRSAVDVTIQSASPEAARALAGYIRTLLQHMVNLVQPEHQLGAAEKVNPRRDVDLQDMLDQLLQPRVEDDQITIDLEANKIDAAVEIAADLIGTAIGPFVQQVTIDRFKSLMLAMHNYHSTYGSFPPAKEARNAGGESPLSWRVHLLPFLGEAELYRQFHLDEPWDSEHNRKLLEKMPDIFRASGILSGGGQVNPGHTVYQTPVGERTIFGRDEPTKFHDVTDGTSNTVAVVEVKPELAVPWTAPDDYRFDSQSPARGLAAGSDGRFVAALADGSAGRFRADQPAETLLHSFQMNDGHVVDLQ